MSRWRVTITDELSDKLVMDITVGRLVAVAAAVACGMQDAAKNIIGDPRSDS